MNRAWMLVAACGWALQAQAAEFAAPLPTETVGKVLTLPAEYPKDWIFIHDASFFAMEAGKVVVLDPGHPASSYKGMVGAGLMSGFLQSVRRKELYIAETFYSRGSRGERTDVITVYDTQTLTPQGEIFLPGGKRGQFMPQRNAFQFTDEERLGLVFNFTPAASVTVVDLAARKVLNEIPLPGCSLIYPSGKRGFSTLCGNGTLMTFQLDADGKEAGRSSTSAFNDIDHDPLFMKTAVIDGINYFLSFKGRVQPIDLRADKAMVGKEWSLVAGEDPSENWRPSGWQILSGDGKQMLYVLMQKDGREGSHKAGGTEVWVFDVRKKTRVARMPLATPAISIEVTRGEVPALIAVNANMELDVYDMVSRSLRHTIGGRVAETPFTMHAVQ